MLHLIGLRNGTIRCCRKSIISLLRGREYNDKQWEKPRQYIQVNNSKTETKAASKSEIDPETESARILFPTIHIASVRESTPKSPFSHLCCFSETADARKQTSGKCIRAWTRYRIRNFDFDMNSEFRQDRRARICLLLLSGRDTLCHHSCCTAHTRVSGALLGFLDSI